MQKWSLPVHRKLVPKFSAMPPIRKSGESPARSSTHETIEVVVVFPCVPATTTEWRPRISSSLIVAAADVYGIRASSTCSTSAFPRGMALPTTTRSGIGSRCAGSYPLRTGMPSSASIVDIGG